MPAAREGENDQVGKLNDLVADQLFSVAGKVALVTGGGSGIGAMITAGLVANGATVYVVSRKDTTEYCSSLNSQSPSGKAIALRADLSKAEEVVALAKDFRYA
jgi:NAD(P)-dependent dehydrogenase (short-subunit alcohol dehydrogenase family)